MSRDSGLKTIQPKVIRKVILNGLNKKGSDCMSSVGKLLARMLADGYMETTSIEKVNIVLRIVTCFVISCGYGLDLLHA